MSIVTYPLNGVTYDAEDAQTYLCTRTSGVYSSDDCFDISITDDMEVTISPGLAWIKNKDYAGMSICMDSAQSITIPLGSGSYPEYDRIVLRFDKESNASSLGLVQGTAEEDASAPDVEQDEEVYELGLYIIYREAGTTELSISDITDTRMDEDVCGIMRDAVTGVPTKVIQASALELIEELRAELEAVEDGSAYMLTSVYDPAGGSRQVAFEDDISNIVEESLPFSLAIVDDTYGYYTTDGTFKSFRQPTGTATASQVLSGYTFSNADSDGLTGTMTNRGAVSKTLTPGSSYTIKEGYHNGSGTVTAKSATASATATLHRATLASSVSGSGSCYATDIDGYEDFTTTNFAINVLSVYVKVTLYEDPPEDTSWSEWGERSLSYSSSSGKVTYTVPNATAGKYNNGDTHKGAATTYANIQCYYATASASISYS